MQLKMTGRKLAWICLGFTAMIVLVVLPFHMLTSGRLQERRVLLQANEDPAEAIRKIAMQSRSTFFVSTQFGAWLRQRLHLTMTDKFRVSSDDVVFMVMASLETSNRVRIQRETWMRWTSHVIVLAEGEDAELGIMTLPELHNKSGFANAQLRQIHGMRWVLNDRPDLMQKKWFFFVDDDTWVNVPVLLDYLSNFPSFLPLSFSHIYLMYNNQAVYNGGAGMLFTETAFRILAGAVLTHACPLKDVDQNFVNNDNILSACAYSMAILKISSSKFSTYEGVLHLQKPIVDTGWLDQITVHKITDAALADDMFCWNAHFLGQLTEKRCSQSEARTVIQAVSRLD